MTTVSVVIATRNRLDLLREAVASVQRQTFADWEILVVDDESTDATSDWAAAHPDPRVRFIRLDRRHERSAARNIGLRSASGRYVLFLDDDDILRTDALRLLVSSLTSRPGTVLATGAYALTDERSRRRRGWHPRRRSQRHMWRDVLFSWSGPPSRVLFDAQAVRGAGGFADDLSFAEDRDLLLRVLRLGPARSVPSIVVDYVMHAGQRSVDGALDALECVLDAHAQSLTAHERVIAARMKEVRQAYRSGMTALTRLDGQSAVAGFARAITADPWVLTSPFVRPQLLRPLAKALLLLIIGKRGMLTIRRAVAWARRRAGRDVWSTQRPR